MAQKILVVTGANKGIGRAIVRNLMSHPPPGYLIYLTARDVTRGETAVSELKKELPSSPSTLLFHQLDITDEASVNKFAKYFSDTHGKKLSVLINNAGIAGKGPGFDADLVKWMLACNYYGTQRLTEAMLPLMHRDGKEKPRIVNVSSTAGRLGILKSEKLKEAFTDSKLTMEGLDQLMQKFQEDVENNTYPEEGWPKQAYGVSKVGVTALTKVFARREKDVLINACCPGWIRTDMAGQHATGTPEEGSQTPVLIAVEDIGGTSGEFWKNEKMQDW